MNFQGNLKGQVALFTRKIISRLAGTTFLRISVVRQACVLQINGMLQASENYKPIHGITLRQRMMERISMHAKMAF